MLIQPKAISNFYYVTVLTFSLLCVWQSAMPLGIKILLSIFALGYTLVDCYCAWKNKVQSFKFFEAKMPYWVLAYSQGICIAKLLPHRVYQSRFFICLFWRQLDITAIQGTHKEFKSLLCRWHYDYESWRALQVLLTTYSPNKTI